MRFLVNIDGLADGRDTYLKRIYLEQEDKRGFLKRLGEKKSKIGGVEAVTIIRDDITEEIKTSTMEFVERDFKEGQKIKEIFKNSLDSRATRTFKCKICNEEFNSGIKVGRHRKEKHPVSS